MPYHWSFYHPGPIEGEVGGILLFRYSVIYVYTWPHLLYLNKNFFWGQVYHILRRVIRFEWVRQKVVSTLIADFNTENRCHLLQLNKTYC